MKEVVKMAMQFNQDTLTQLQQEAHTKVLEGSYVQYPSGTGRYVHPAADIESFNNFEQLLSRVAELALDGRAIYPHESPHHAPAFWQVHFYKPQSEIKVLLAESDKQVEQQYLASIAEHNLTQQNLLIEQMVQAELAKESKKEEQRLQAIRDKATKTAREFIQSQLKQEAK